VRDTPDFEPFNHLSSIQQPVRIETITSLHCKVWDNPDDDDELSKKWAAYEKRVPKLDTRNSPVDGLLIFHRILADILIFQLTF